MKSDQLKLYRNHKKHIHSCFWENKAFTCTKDAGNHYIMLSKISFLGFLFITVIIFHFHFAKICHNCHKIYHKHIYHKHVNFYIYNKMFIYHKHVKYIITCHHVIIGKFGKHFCHITVVHKHVYCLLVDNT